MGRELVSENVSLPLPLCVGRTREPLRNPCGVLLDELVHSGVVN